MTGSRAPDQRETSVFGSNLERGFSYAETCDRRWATKIDKLLERHAQSIRDYGGSSKSSIVANLTRAGRLVARAQETIAELERRHPLPPGVSG